MCKTLKSPHNPCTLLLAGSRMHTLPVCTAESSASSQSAALQSFPTFPVPFSGPHECFSAHCAGAPSRAGLPPTSCVLLLPAAHQRVESFRLAYTDLEVNNSRLIEIPFFVCLHTQHSNASSVEKLSLSPCLLHRTFVFHFSLEFSGLAKCQSRD